MLSLPCHAELAVLLLGPCRTQMSCRLPCSFCEHCKCVLILLQFMQAYHAAGADVVGCIACSVTDDANCIVNKRKTDFKAMQGTSIHRFVLCRVTGRLQGPGVSHTEGTSSTALLSRDDASVGPSEDEESLLLPGNSQSRRTTNGSLDSIFEKMESQPVSFYLASHLCMLYILFYLASQLHTTLTEKRKTSLHL